MKIKPTTVARWWLGETWKYPVTIIPGSDQAPETEGRLGGWETMGGRPIYHPSAYSRVGWSNMRYRCSSYKITVGERWLAKHQARPLMGGTDRYGRPVRIWIIGDGFRIGKGLRAYPGWSDFGWHCYWIIRGAGRRRVEIYPRARDCRPSQEAAEAVIRANHPVAKRLLAAG